MFDVMQLLSTLDVNARGKTIGQKFNVNLNRNRIRSISSYSSNSIFYFKAIVSDQITPEEMTMTQRFLEKSYASFVTACVSLMPFHRIHADDQGAIEDYLNQFHQNMGVSDGGSTLMRKVFNTADALIGQNESYVPSEELAEVGKILAECWNRAKGDLRDYVDEVQKITPLYEMYNKDPLDSLTRAIQEQYWKNMAEMDRWGFLGEATPTMFDGSEDAFGGSDEELDDSVEDEDFEDLDVDDIDDWLSEEDFDDEELLSDEWEDDDDALDNLVEGALMKKLNGSTSFWQKSYEEALKNGKTEAMAREYADRKVADAKAAMKKAKDVTREKVRSFKLKKTIIDNQTKGPEKKIYGTNSRVQSVKGDPRKRVQESVNRLMISGNMLDDEALYGIMLDESKSFDERFAAMKKTYDKGLYNKVANQRIRGSLRTAGANLKLKGITGRGGVVGAARTDKDLDQLEQFLVGRHNTRSWSARSDPYGFEDDTYDLLDQVRSKRQMLKQLGQGTGKSTISDAEWETLSAEKAKRDSARTEAENLALRKREIESREELARATHRQANATSVMAGTYAYDTYKNWHPALENVSFDYDETVRMMAETADLLNELNLGQLQAAEHEFDSRFNGYIKNAKTAIANANVAMAQGDYVGAKKNLTFALAQLKEGRKIANKIDDDGWLAGILQGIALSLVPVIGPIIWYVRGFTGWYKLREKAAAGEMEYSKVHPKLQPNVFLEFLGAATGFARARGYSRANILNVYDKLISTVNSSISAIDSAAKDGAKINETVIIDEGVLSMSPLRRKLKKLEQIKASFPKSGADDNEIVKFINANYNDIRDMAYTLENEPTEFRKSNDTMKAIMWIPFLAWCASTIVSVPAGLVAVLTLVIDIVLAMLFTIIGILRASDDRNAKRDLNAILANLKKIKVDNYPEAQKKKVLACIQAIESSNRVTDHEPALELRESAEGDAAAITSIQATLDKIPDNKIKSCTKLTTLASMKSELEKLKGGYTRYLNRYKKKDMENQRRGENQKLTIKFEGMTISDPHAFMARYGEINKKVNRKLALIKARSEELHGRKGLPMPESEVDEAFALSPLHVEMIRRCTAQINEAVLSPDSVIFGYLDEAPTVQDAATVASSLKSAISTIDRGLDLVDRMSGNDRNARPQVKDHWNDEHPYMNGPRFDANGKPIPSVQPSGPYWSRNRAKSGINYAAAASRGADRVDTFGKEVFTNMEMKKANEAIPTFVHVGVTFIVDETEQTVTRDVMIGIKVVIEKAKAKDLIDDIYQAIMNKRKFLKFVKWASGEEKSLADLLFGFKEMKLDAINSRKPGAARWLPAFRSRKRWNRFSVPYLTGNFTPNGSLVLTMAEINFLKSEYGLDMMRADHIKMMMDQNFLLAFVVIDQSNEIVHVSYDGHNGSFEEYPYQSLQREQTTNDRMLRTLYQQMQR